MKFTVDLALKSGVSTSTVVCVCVCVSTTKCMLHVQARLSMRGARGIIIIWEGMTCVIVNM